MPEQSGLLHTWGQLHKTMQRGLRRLLATDSELAQNLQHVRLLALYHQILDRARHIASALKIEFVARYDDRLPLVIRGNAVQLPLAMFTMLDYVMLRHPGVGYTIFEVKLTEEAERDYVSFTAWRTGVRGHKTYGVRQWSIQDEMERFVAHMGGYFFAEGQHGTEARYSIGIPLIPGDPSNVTPVPQEAFTARLAQAKEGITALVVGDSVNSRVLSVLLSSRHNIGVDVVENGRGALEKLSDRRPDLLFVDYSMPGLDGRQTVDAIRAHEQGKPRTSLIVGMSLGEDPAAKMEAAFLAAGMQGYLAKPVDPLKLNLLLLHLLLCLRGQAAEAPADVPEPIDSARQDVLRTLSGIAGLDAEKGLLNAGHSVEIFTGMLRRFTAELTDYIEPLLTLSLGASWEEVAIRLHVLHEFFAGIGAEELAREAADLAAAADTGGDSTWMPRIRRYCDAMMRLRAELVGLKAANRGSAVERRTWEGVRTEPMDMATLKEHMTRLHDACLSCRATEAQAIADGLRKMALRKDIETQIEAVCALVDSLDYQEAQERCVCLLKTIEACEGGAAS